MPKRSEKRGAAKAEYIARRSRGEEVNLRELAEALGAKYQTLRNWKKVDHWDEDVPKPKPRRGRPPGKAAGESDVKAEGKTGGKIGGKAGRRPGSQNGAGSDGTAGAAEFGGAPGGTGEEARGNRPRKRGGQPGNRNSAGHRNAAGSHKGAPPGNKNAEKDGAYSAVFLDLLTEEERKVAEAAVMESRPALEEEMRILKVREHRILERIAAYESAAEDALYVNSMTDMREPSGSGEGTVRKMAVYNKESGFARVAKLQEALYKVQGRIAKITDSFHAMEEAGERMQLERERLDILRMRATGAIDMDGPEEEDIGEDGA